MDTERVSDEELAALLDGVDFDDPVHWHTLRLIERALRELQSRRAAQSADRAAIIEECAMVAEECADRSWKEAKHYKTMPDDGSYGQCLADVLVAKDIGKAIRALSHTGRVK